MTTLPAIAESGPSFPRVPKTFGGLVMSLGGIVAHRDLRAWTNFLTLPSLVLAAQSWSGRKHAHRQENDTKRRCKDWISGFQAELWALADVGPSRSRFTSNR